MRRHWEQEGKSKRVRSEEGKAAPFILLSWVRYTWLLPRNCRVELGQNANNYACKQDHRITVFRETLSRCWLKLMQIPTAKRWTEVLNVNGRIGEGSKTQNGMGSPQEDQESQLIWIPGNSQRPSCQPTNIYGLERSPWHIRSRHLLSFHHCFVRPWWERMHLIWERLDESGWKDTGEVRAGGTLSEEKRKREEERQCKGGTKRGAAFGMLIN